MPLIYQPDEDSYLMESVLMEKLPELVLKKPSLKFLEIGCGSGIQLKAALNAGVKKENILGTDINKNAVDYCRKEGFNCIESDLFKNVKGSFDVIVFNPPYLPEDKKEPLSSALSTTGGKQGAEIINKFLEEARQHLNKEGRVFILTSSLTKKVNFKGYKKRVVARKKLFFEELNVFELRISNKNRKPKDL